MHGRETIVLIVKTSVDGTAVWLSETHAEKHSQTSCRFLGCDGAVRSSHPPPASSKQTVRVHRVLVRFHGESMWRFLNTSANSLHASLQKAEPGPLPSQTYSLRAPDTQEAGPWRCVTSEAGAHNRWPPCLPRGLPALRNQPPRRGDAQASSSAKRPSPAASTSPVAV